MSEELRIVTTVSNEAESEMVMEQLEEVGIRSMPHLHRDNIRLGAAAPLDIYVQVADYDEALEVIGAEVPSAAEPEAPRQETTTQQTQPKGIDPKTGKSFEPVEIPVPKRSAFDGLLERAERPSRDERDA